MVSERIVRATITIIAMVRDRVGGREGKVAILPIAAVWLVGDEI